MKIQTINFRDFVRNDYREESKKPTKLMSVSVPLAIATPSPLIAKGYTVVLIAGAVLIGSAILERKLVMNKKSKAARTIHETIQILIPWLIIGGLVFFVLINPLL